MPSGDIYKTSTGIVSRRVAATSQDMIDAQVDIGEAYIAGHINAETHYYDPGASYASTARPTMGLTFSEAAVDGVYSIATDELLTISDIPVDTVVIHPSGSVEVDDGELEWGCIEPGEYELIFNNDPYVVERVRIVVEA